MWDIAGESFDSFGDIGMLVIANVSLDEPDLEDVIFVDKIDDVNEVEDEAVKA